MAPTAIHTKPAVEGLAVGTRSPYGKTYPTAQGRALAPAAELRIVAYLLDTNVVSELRRPKPNPAVVRWIENTPAESLFLSAVTVGEIQAGIEVTREQDSKKADELENWLAQVVASHQVLSMDADAFREWGRVKHRRSITLIVDAMIAATAKVHALTVATRNLDDFDILGVSTFDPFDPSQQPTQAAELASNRATE